MVGIPAEQATGEPPPVVLLVEDDVDTADMYEIYLNSIGYRVATAHTEEAAFRTFDNLGPDIVVTDLGLPGRSSGLDFIQHVSARPTEASVPIIVVTGHDPKSVPHASAASVTRILTKPVLPAALANEVRLTLERSARLRRRGDAARRAVPHLLQRSQALQLRSRDVTARGQALFAARPCPGCGRLVRWTNTRDVDGTTLDYYAACDSGCGRFYFNRSSGVPIQLS